MKFYAENNFLPETSFGYMMRRSLQAALQLLEPEFAAEGLTGTQWPALACLLFERETMISELAKYLGHDTGATTRLVDQLEQRGLVVRERRSEDRRCIHLRLTDEGTAVTERCRKSVFGCWNDWLADWREEEASTILSLLLKLQTSLETAGTKAVRSKPASRKAFE